MSKSKSLARGFASGITFNYDDELGGAVGALLGKALYSDLYKGVSYKDLKKELTEDLRRSKQTREEQNYGASLGGEVLGAIANPLNFALAGGGVAAKGGKVAKKVAKNFNKIYGRRNLFSAAAGGATAGLIDESGRITPEQTNRSTLGQSSSFGAVGGVLGHGAGRILQGAGRLTNNLLGGSAGADKKLNQMLNSSIKSSDIDDKIKKLSDTSAKGRDALTLIDVGGEGLAKRARGIAAKDSILMSETREFLDDRKDRAGEILINGVNDALRGNKPSIDIDAIIKRRDQEAQILYGRARDEAFTTKAVSDATGQVRKVKVSKLKKSDDIYKNKTIVQAIKKAKGTYYEDSTPEVGFDALLGAKKYIDDQIGGAVRQGHNSKARILQGVKGKIVAKLEEVAPSFKEANKRFRDESALKDAHKLGLGALKTSKNVNEIKKEFAKLNAGEREAYQSGIAEKIGSQIDGLSDSADPAKRILNNETVRKKLRAITSPEDYKKLEKIVNEERLKSSVRSSMTQGSATAENLAGQTLFDKASNIAGIPIYIANLIPDMLSKMSLGDKAKEKIMQTLLSNDGGIKALKRMRALHPDLKERKILSEMIDLSRGLSVSGGQSLEKVGLGETIREY